MTEPNANDAGELNLEQLETVAGGALNLGGGSNYIPIGTSPTNIQGTSAANAVSLTLSGSSVLSVGTITMPTTTANPSQPMALPTLPSTVTVGSVGMTPGIVIDPLAGGTGGFTIG